MSNHMDGEEVDIGTIRNLETKSWVLPHLPDGTLPEHPPITTALDHPMSSPESCQKSGAAPDLALPGLDVDKIMKMRRWMIFVAVVKFDLDVGPVLDCLYPFVQLSSECRENIAFSSFPDSSIFETGSQSHSFKLIDLATEELPSSIAYGYAHFMQRRDENNKRGYLQRSIVILSRLPFPSLFEELLSILAPLHLSHGRPVFESACQSIASWPDPSSGSFLKLDFLGRRFHVHLPSTDDEVQFHDVSETFDPLPHILASVPPTNPPPVVIFSSCLASLWSIWELLLLGEPILIIGPSPRIVSLAVWWLRDLIRPIPLAGDFRPYITIHDRDYASLINKSPPKAGLIVGVTNPFTLSVTKHWPHALGLSSNDKITSSHKGKGKGKGKGSRDMAGSGAVFGLFSQTHKRFTSKDRTLLKMWELAVTKGGHFEHVASLELRQHFSSRTASFLVPLNRYLNSLIPKPTEASIETIPRSKPRLKPFIPNDFLKSLRTHGTPLPFKSSVKQQEFYERWLKTPAFALWLANQEEVVAAVLDGN